MAIFKQYGITYITNLIDVVSNAPITSKTNVAIFSLRINKLIGPSLFSFFGKLSFNKLEFGDL